MTAPRQDGRNWDSVDLRKTHYLDAFLGDLKRRAHLDLIERWSGRSASGRVLKTDLFEEAMGPDAYLPELSRGGPVIGIDISPVLVQKASRRFPGCSLTVADTRELPFCDGSFALIVSPSTLDHFREPRDLSVSLRELRRVLEPGGRLIVTLDNRQNIFDPLLRLAKHARLLPYYLGRSYTVRELRQELERAGLVVEEATAILHNPRLTAVGMVALARTLRWRPLMRLVQRALVQAQRLEHTRWRYYTGSFVAANAIKPR